MDLMIKEISELFGNTRGAIRFYQEKGIISPRVEENGFRHYSMDDLFQLMYMKKFETLSFSLKEVALHFRRESTTSVDAVERMFEEKYKQAEEEIRRLVFCQWALERYRKAIEQYRSGETITETCPEYWVIDEKNLPVFYDTEYGSLKKMIELIPKTEVLRRFSEDSRGKRREIGIEANLAQEYGIPFSPLMTVMPKAIVKSRVVSIRGTEVDQQLWEAHVQFCQEEKNNIKQSVDAPSSSLLFVLGEGKDDWIEFHKLYIPVEAI